MDTGTYNYSYSQPTNKRPLAPWIVGGAMALLIIGLVVWIAASRTSQSGKVPIDIHVVPTQATVLLDNTPVSGTAYVTPGTHTIKVSADGFQSYTLTHYLVDSSIEDMVLAVTLESKSDAAKTYAQENQELYSKQEGYGATQAEQQSAIMFKKNPVLEKLPYTNLIYSIGYTVDKNKPDQPITLTIRAPVGSRNAAVNQINELGFDPADYKIKFIDYVNPFENE